MIVGAGLAGLIAAHAFPRSAIFEVQPRPNSIHKALLRFRSDAVSQLVGIPFRKVTVRKGIFLGGWWVEPNIAAGNLYSQKVLGKVLDRSIWSTDPVTRYVAPEDFYEQLLSAAEHRIHWGTAFEFNRVRPEPVINTAPLPIALKELGMSAAHLTFDRAPIQVMRFRIPNCDVFQTVYYPDPAHSLYRASITGDLLICEFADGAHGDWEREVAHSFGIHEWHPLESTKQAYGKIAPIDDRERKALVARLTTEANIFSLGRFATWRNILLDDVIHDIAVVKQLITASAYERRLAAI